MMPPSTWESTEIPKRVVSGMKLELEVLEGVEISLYDRDRGYALWSVSVGRNLFDAAKALRKRLFFQGDSPMLEGFLVKANSVLYVNILGRMFVLDYLGVTKEIPPGEFQALFTREDLETLKHRRTK